MQTLYAGLRLTIDRKGSRPEPARAPAIAEVTLASHGTEASCSRRGLAAVTAAGLRVRKGCSEATWRWRDSLLVSFPQ